MPTQIRTSEPNSTLSFNGESFTSDDQGLVSVPDAAVKILIESHGCADPSAKHKFGLSIVAKDRGFQVIDANGVAIHGGVINRGAAQTILNSWTPSEPEAVDEAPKPSKKNTKAAD